MKKVFFVFAIVVLLLTGCAAPEQLQTQAPVSLRFVPQLSMFEEGTVHFEFGVANDSQAEFTGMKDVNIQVVVMDDAGEIRNQMWIKELHTIPGEDSNFPLIYEAIYEPGTYDVTITGKEIPTMSFSFQIRVVDGVHMLVASPEFVNPFTEFTITEVDF
jgi:hypothetical protein